MLWGFTQDICGVLDIGCLVTGSLNRGGDIVICLWTPTLLRG